MSAFGSHTALEKIIKHIFIDIISYRDAQIYPTRAKSRISGFQRDSRYEGSQIRSPPCKKSMSKRSSYPRPARPPGSGGRGGLAPTMRAVVWSSSLTSGSAWCCNRTSGDNQTFLELIHPCFGSDEQGALSLFFQTHFWTFQIFF